MKITVLKKDLVRILSRPQNIVEKRNAMPVLVNVLLQAERNLLTIFATDLEVSLKDACAAEISLEGKVAVNARNLFDITRELSEGPIQLIKKENHWLEIKQGKYTSKLVGVSAEEYPIFPVYENGNFLKLQSDALREMIEKTIYSVSNDETRYHLNGVYFEQKDQNEYSMVATDGHRLSLIIKKSENPIQLPSGGVIIPRKGLNEIKKLVDSEEGAIYLAVDGSQLILKHEETVLMVRLIEGKYPNYQQFIPQKFSQKLTVNREAFLSSLKRVSLLANYKSKAVTLSIANGKMEIASNNPELGDAKEELEIDYQGKDLKIGFNAKYITDVLTVIQDDEVDVEINDQLSPGLVRPHNDANYTCVVMPMRI
jgi:DNA polymerase-3 subunit beta